MAENPKPPARQPRMHVSLRLTEAGLHAIDQRAEAEGRTRSDLIRLALRYAMIYMPKGWTGQ